MVFGEPNKPLSRRTAGVIAHMRATIHACILFFFFLTRVNFLSAKTRALIFGCRELNYGSCVATPRSNMHRSNRISAETSANKERKEEATLCYVTYRSENTSIFFMIFFLSPLLAALFPTPSNVRARRRDRVAAEQRRGINNLEFPAGVPIIRFQGPPILAESYVRRRIHGPTLRPLPCRERFTSASPLLALPSLPPSFPLNVLTTHFRLLMLSSLPSSLCLFSPFLFASTPVPYCKLRQQREQTKRGSHPCKCAQHIYGAENCRTLTAKNAVV